MRDHVAYWSSMAERGTAIVFGPVADPDGAWGLGILEVEDEKDAQIVTSNDPVMRSEIGATYEIFPMSRAVVGKKRE